MSKSDEQILEMIKKVISRGNNVEVKRRTDGTLAVYEVKKNIVAK